MSTNATTTRSTVSFELLPMQWWVMPLPMDKDGYWCIQYYDDGTVGGGHDSRITFDDGLGESATVVHAYADRPEGSMRCDLYALVRGEKPPTTNPRWRKVGGPTMLHHTDVHA